MKNGNPVGTLIHSNQLNRVFQDGWKGHYLCSDCESNFSKLEGWFCKKIYDPFVDNGSIKINYDVKLGLFAASIVFRYMQFAFDANPTKPIHTNFSHMFDNLRVSLLQKKFPSITSNFYIQFHFPITCLDKFPPGINTYYFESIDGKCFDYIIPSAGQFWVVYVKLPGVFFICSEWDLQQIFQPPELVESHRILETGVLDSNTQTGKLEVLVEDIFIKRAVEIQENYSKMPAERLQKIAHKLEALPNKEKFRSHNSFTLDQNLMTKLQKNSVSQN